jgi:hypothetical protein
MSTNEIVSTAIKNTTKTLAGSHAIYAIERSDKIENLDNLSNSITTLHDLFLKNDPAIIDEPIRFYLSNHGPTNNRSLQFAPHLMIGKSPFLFHKEGKKILGVQVKLQLVSNCPCEKLANAMAKELYLEHFKKDLEINMKRAKEMALDKIEDDKIEIPTNTYSSDHFFYIDFASERILTKGGNKDIEAVRAFFYLMTTIGNRLIASDTLSSSQIDDIETMGLGNYNAVPYALYLMRSGITAAPYGISKLVEFYSQETNKCDMFPLWSASFEIKDTSRTSVSLKNSAQVFMTEGGANTTSLNSFEAIHSFAEEKNLNISAVTTQGEIAYSSFVQNFFQEHPEYASENSNYMDMTYSTFAKDGNVCFKILNKDDLTSTACRILLSDYFREHHTPQKDVEGIILDMMGNMLYILHNSADEFTKLYKAVTTVHDDSTLQNANGEIIAHLR